MPSTHDAVRDAYAHCRQIVKNHYENFPVASLLLPKPLRDPIAAIYAFARRADDFADEGSDPPQQRLQDLDSMDQQLRQLANGESVADPVFVALNDAIQRHQLPLPLFHDLISAFKQDVHCKRYPDFDSVLDYCRRSANPIGRLLLYLTGQASAQNLSDSDKICSALQVINFLQDMQQDMLENQRIYMPLCDLERFRVSEAHFQNAIADKAMHELFDFELARAKNLLLQGAALGSRIGGRFGMQLRMMIGGGLRVCKQLAALENCFDRPRLRRSDWLILAKYAIMPRTYIQDTKPSPTKSTGLETETADK